ncbi:MAG: hypothetical protein G3I10_05905 [Ferrovum sp.]|jgi:hypothetical protein|nr:hypothetical protein [Ferrovum sp.]
MAMSPDDFDFISGFSTLWQVVLGAVLATLGGFAATQMERMVLRRERERSAALLFGELIVTISILIDEAKVARSRGEPYGMYTMRLLRSVHRELDIYERNRERLGDLEQSALRGRVYNFMVRLSIALEGIFDTTHELRELKLKGPGGDAHLMRQKELEDLRDQGFTFMLATTDLVPELLQSFERIARHSFSNLGDMARRVNHNDTLAAKSV